MQLPPRSVDDAETLKALRSFNKQGILNGHTKLRRAAEFLEGGGATRLSFPCYLDAFCKPISLSTREKPLQPISIPELQLDHWHQGRVLRGFLCTKAFRFVKAGASVLEDATGKAARILVSSVVFPDFFTKDPDALLPQGAEVTIKEPCLVESNMFCHGTSLWVSNPACIKIHSPANICTSAYQNSARQEFIKGNFSGAVELYSKALHTKAQKSKNEIVQCFSGRAEAWLCMGYPLKALDDCEQALKLKPHDYTSLVTNVRALWKLDQYAAAEALLVKTLSSEPAHTRDSAALQSLIKEAEVLSEQSSGGTHDVSRFLMTNSGAPTVAEFVGPVRIEMTSDGRGRGLFLTKNVQRGDLLLVSNAAVRLPLTEELAAELDRADSSKLLAHLLQVCMGSPKTLAQVYTMAEMLRHDLSKPQRKVVEKDAPSMELFKPDWNMQKLAEHCQEMEFDVVRIQNVLDCSTEFVLSKDYEAEFVGFWTLPAFINHSCLPNVCMRKFGRGLWVFAARDLKCGSELLRSYGYSMRPRVLRQSNRSFECNCARCELEIRLEVPLSEINSRFLKLLYKKLKDFSDYCEYTQLAVEIEQVLEKEGLNETEKGWIRATYPAAYRAFHEATETKVKMPNADDLLRALHETAPGDAMTLAEMLSYRKKATETGLELLEQEVCATHGHLDPELVKQLLKYDDIGATT